MAKKEWRWVRVKPMTSEEKKAFTAACDRFVAEVLKPRWVPEIRPMAERNYPFDLRGKARGRSYSFVVRFRSGFPDNAGEAFDAPFARFDHDEESVEDLRFHVMWFRHTGKWWHLHSSKTLPEALALLEGDPVLRPPV